MSYMRYGADLRWFNGTSEEYVYGSINKEDEQIMCGWAGDTFKNPIQWIELVARIVYRETKDMEFVDFMVRKLAKDYGVEQHLHDDVVERLEDRIRRALCY